MTRVHPDQLGLAPADPHGQPCPVCRRNAAYDVATGALLALTVAGWLGPLCRSCVRDLLGQKFLYLLGALDDLHRTAEAIPLGDQAAAVVRLALAAVRLLAGDDDQAAGRAGG